MNKEEVMKASAELQKKLDAKSYADALDIMRQLKNNMQATDVLIRETRVGLVIGKLRKYPNKEIADMSNEIVKKWKQDVDDAKLKNGTKTQSKAQTGSQPAKSESAPSQGKTTQKEKEKAPRTVETDGVKLPTYMDTVRVNCIKLAYNSLAIDAADSVSKESLLQCATAIENTTYDKFDKKVDGPYKQKMRSLCLNLKGQNVSLRRDVVSGDLTPETFCSMTPEEMASDERKAMNKKLLDDSIFKAMAATNTKASTDAFKCSKCGKNETTYYQMQTVWHSIDPS